MNRTFYIETVGCQMNVLDSELVRAGLLQAGYVPAEDRRRADVILFNTCSVRQHAEDKVYSALGRLKHIKEHRPDAIIGVMGCMAQKDQQLILQRAPHVDLVVGPGQIGRIPELIRGIVERRASCCPCDATDTTEPVMEISLERRGRKRSEVEESFEAFDPLRIAEARDMPHQAMVRVMFGCDKFCTYCIVPSVRGPEQSRPAAEIVDEIRRLADQGCLEVTMLGQTVNAYRDDSSGREMRLADLLEQVNAVDGIRRIRFVTNYPAYMTDDLLRAVRDLPKVSPYLHVPVQSGSDRILQRMNRSYTVAEYRDMIERIRATVPDAAVTSDFIVGFCGETEEDFRQTVDLVEFGRFKNSFIFKYSVREGTKAASLYEDDVPYPVKQRRNNELLDVQNKISWELNEPFVGRSVKILVEGPSKAAAKRDASENGGESDVTQLTGRTICDRIVVFDGPPSLTGRFANVEIENVNSFTLFGRLSESEAGS